MTTILLQRFANREYRLTHQNVIGGKPKGGDKYADVQNERYAQAVHDTYVLQKSLEQGETASIADGRLERSTFGEVAARQAIRSLDIINEFHLVQKVVQKGGWGNLAKPTRFTKNARHRLLEAGAVVDAACGLNAWEITCTIAGSGRDVFNAVAAHTGWIMNELTRLLRKAKCKYWFYVWELQKRGALHLHMLIADTTECLSDLATRLESRWWAIQQSLSVRTGLDLFRKNKKITWKDRPDKWQSHVAPIKKSVAAYFSKYAGKGVSDTLKGKGFQTVGTPSRWWGSSREVKKLITETREKWKWEISPSCAKEVESVLRTFTDSRPRVKAYGYEFQLGQTVNGTELGGGQVWINYYSDADFKVMQTWEEYYLIQVQDVLRRHGYADIDTQTWTNADMACPTLYDADLAQRRHDTGNADMKTRRLPQPPLNQPIPDIRKLRKARGTQAQPTLALRARMIQFLAGGGGETTPVQVDHEQATEYIQGELFDKSYYEGIDIEKLSYEVWGEIGEI